MAAVLQRGFFSQTALADNMAGANRLKPSSGNLFFITTDESGVMSTTRPFIEGVYLENVFPALGQIFGSWVVLFFFVALFLGVLAFALLVTVPKWGKRTGGQPPNAAHRPNATTAGHPPSRQ